MTNIAFPFRIDARGRTAEVDRTRHLRDMIEVLLFTAPGERVMRPTFGANLLASVFAPGGSEEAAALQVLVMSALQEHLRDVIQVSEVALSAEDSTVTAKVVYAIIQTGEQREDIFQRAAP